MICAPVQLIAPGNTPTTAGYLKALKELVLFLKDTIEVNLKFVPLDDLRTVRLVLYIDASFAIARGLKSQLGYTIALVDDSGRANTVHS